MAVSVSPTTCQQWKLFTVPLFFDRYVGVMLMPNLLDCGQVCLIRLLKSCHMETVVQPQCSIQWSGLLFSRNFNIQTHDKSCCPNTSPPTTWNRYQVLFPTLPRMRHTPFLSTNSCLARDLFFYAHCLHRNYAHLKSGSQWYTKKVPICEGFHRKSKEV